MISVAAQNTEILVFINSLALSEHQASLSKYTAISSREIFHKINKITKKIQLDNKNLIHTSEWTNLKEIVL